MEENTVKKGGGLSIAALVLGIIGAVLAFIPVVNNAAFFIGALALIFGIIGICKKVGTGKAIAGLVLGIIAVIITLVMQSAVYNALDKASDTLSSSLADLSGDNTEDILANSLDVKFGKYIYNDDEYFATGKLPLTVKNKGNENQSYSIQIEAIDKNGKRLETDTVYVNSLGAGQSQDFEAFTLVTGDSAKALKTAEFKVVEVSKF